MYPGTIARPGRNDGAGNRGRREIVKHIVRSLIATVAIAAAAPSALAQSASSIPPPRPVVHTLPPAPSAPENPVWKRFAKDIEEMWPRIYQNAPKRIRDNPQTRAELSRLLLEAMAQRILDALGQDGEHPAFLPHISYYMNVGQPNADTIYKRAVITPGGTYRLRGKPGTLTITKMAQLGATPELTGGGVRALGYSDFSKLRVGPDGRFDVILSPSRPTGYAGDWWQLDPSASSLLLRQVGQDWAGEQDPKISIERIDVPVAKSRATAGELEQRLAGVPMQSYLIAAFLVDHAEQLREQGYINKLRVFDVSNGGALEGQFYYEGVYELKPDEALVIESKVPEHCRYSSLILTNEIYETTNWIDNQASLNGAQYAVDKDGVLRVVIADRDPGVLNWLDTSGNPAGVVQGRWTECTAHPVPTAKLVKLADLPRELPADTRRVSAEERERLVRERRAAWLQRAQW